ncbi:transmembrane and death domain protein 1 [Amia ocellicauda]|uniref:transmembrane and death domain protein 1 n=1 Tax=Amia ocellicauda TaxID=2972642 RepID=UPI003463FE3C
MERIAELLTPGECQDLHSALTSPEEDIFQRMERLSAENNDLEIPERVRRDIITEEQCKTTLTEWLLAHGDQMYYDRLLRALQRIGRTDIALEVGKNINQEKSLNLLKYVEGYHKQAEAMQSPLIQKDPSPQTDSQRTAREITEMSWSDMELIVEREQLPPYSKQLRDGLKPLFYGIILGFTGAFLLGGVIVLFALHISERDCRELLQLSIHSEGRRRRCRSSQTRFIDTLYSSDSDYLSRDNTPLRHKKSSTKDFHGFFPAFRLASGIKALKAKIYR